jgi:hypothetical protein
MNLPLLARMLFLAAFVGAVPALAATRNLTIDAPASVKPGTSAHVIVVASTNTTDAEQIGFIHAEYSADGGQTWSPVYAEKVGRTFTRAINIPVGAEGTKAIVRVRAAYRGGKAGDVDFTGAPIKWDGSWSKWETPPTKIATINVSAR